MIENIPEYVLGSPILAAGLTIVMILGWHWQSGLGYREFRLIHRAKIVVFVTLNDWATSKGRSLVNVKTWQHKEFVLSVDSTPRETCSKLIDAGFTPHLIATLKKRVGGNREQYAHSQWSKKDGEYQVEVYLFPSNSGGTDVYAHYEPLITNPPKHLSGEQTDGDVTGSVREALE